MAYQHAILPVNARLEVQVEGELHGRWYVRYRVVTPGFEHLEQWRAFPHCSQEEAVDVLNAVAEGFTQDYDAQGLF